MESVPKTRGNKDADWVWQDAYWKNPRANGLFGSNELKLPSPRSLARNTMISSVSVSPTLRSAKSRVDATSLVSIYAFASNVRPRGLACLHNERLDTAEVELLGAGRGVMAITICVKLPI